MNLRHPTRGTVAAVCLLALGPRLQADRHVTVTAHADPAYLQHKYGGTEPLAESCVFMQGHYFEGISRDHSIEQMSFRRVAEFLAPELARARYFPTKDIPAADLLLVVHWGTTMPQVSSAEMRAVTSTSVDDTEARKLHDEVTAAMSAGGDFVGAMLSPGYETGSEMRFEESTRITDTLANDMSAATNAQLLGYTQDLRRLSRSMVSTAEEYALRSNLNEERYFVIVKAYDLHEKVEAGHPRHIVWSLYMNIRSPGNNFPGALHLMTVAASGLFGRETDGVQTIRSSPRAGSVTLAPIVILGEVK